MRMAKRTKKLKGKILNGSELAGYIKQRHMSAVRRFSVIPKLAIVRTLDVPEIATFVRLKREYGEDIGVEVEDRLCKSSELQQVINERNTTEDVDGVIVQLPLSKPEYTEEILALIDPSKDVDALTHDTQFDSVTPTAILWLLAGYNIDLRGKDIAVIGQGRLVGKPLSDMLEASGHDVTRCDVNTEGLRSVVESHSVIISGAGQPNLIKNDWLQSGAVVVDAGTSSENGQLVGDVESSARERADLKITPVKGGVGPLTIAALFENVLLAAARRDGVD